LLKVEVKSLKRFNALGDVMCATRHTNTLVGRGQNIATTRAIPLLIERTRVQQAVNIAREGLEVLRVLPLRPAKVGVLITGGEVYYGRIQDRFEPIIRQKVESLGGVVMGVAFLPDDAARISGEAIDFVERGADVLITTGGMSVDPDDRTRFALELAGAEEVIYGLAVVPGAMFMVAYLREVPVLGIPACGIYSKATVFDLLYPRILAGERLTRKDLASMGHGGYCLKCDTCDYPLCPFGKGA
jgi:molybdopterin biosynthesis enzyme